MAGEVRIVATCRRRDGDTGGGADGGLVCSARGRWAELHAYTELAHVRWVIDRFCENGGGMGAYHGISYGAFLGVWTIQRGGVAGFVDLQPFIEVKLGDKPALRLDNNSACCALVRARQKEVVLEKRANKERDEDEDLDEDLDEDEDDLDEDLLDDDGWQVFEEIELKADWKAIAAKLPPLEPPLPLSGERATQHQSPDVAKPDESYFYLNGHIRFGSYEVENGDTLPGPVPFKDLPTEPEDDDDED